MLIAINELVFLCFSFLYKNRSNICHSSGKYFWNGNRKLQLVPQNCWICAQKRCPSSLGSWLFSQCFQQLNVIKAWGCFSNVTHSCRGQSPSNISGCQNGAGSAGGSGCNLVYAKGEHSEPFMCDLWVNAGSVLDVRHPAETCNIQSVGCGKWRSLVILTWGKFNSVSSQSESVQGPLHCACSTELRINLLSCVS